MLEYWNIGILEKQEKTDQMTKGLVFESSISPSFHYSNFPVSV